MEKIGIRAAIQRNPLVVAQSVDSRLVLVHLETNQIFSLNDSAARLWHLLTTPNSVTALVDALDQVYAVDRDVLTRDVQRTIAYLRENELVLTCGNG